MRLRMKWCLALFAAAAALAQSPPEASISGTVRDAGTGSPVAKAPIGLVAQVTERPVEPRQTAVTDADGRYTFTGLVPGQYQIRAGGGGFVGDAKTVRVSEAERATGVDFRLLRYGTISGTVTEGREPAPGVSVCLVDRIYSFGALRNVLAACRPANANGGFEVNAMPGRGVLLMARKTVAASDAQSALAEEIAERPPVTATVYYPGTPAIRAAEALVLRPGEVREHVDLQLRPESNLCVAGTVQWKDPEPLEFSMVEAEPVTGVAVMVHGPGLIPEDRTFRICNLHPGDYRLTVLSHEAPPGAPLMAFLGIADLTLTDKDITGLAIAPEPSFTIPGEVVWEKEAPESGEARYLNIVPLPVRRMPYRGEYSPERPQIPGAFRLENLRAAEYQLSLQGIPADAYLKDVSFGGRSILYESFRPASAPGEGVLRIVLARDGGMASIRVEDAEGKPVADVNVVLMPAGVVSEAALAGSLAFGQTGPDGLWTSALTAPGKYRVLATREPVDLSFESVANLWRSYAGAKELEVSPGSAVAVRLRM